MRLYSPMETIDWINRNNGLLMLLLTAVYVLATIVLVALTGRQVKAVYDLEKQRSRPFVRLVPSMDRVVVNITIRNTGLTVANNVRFAFTPPLTPVLGGESSVPRQLEDHPIPAITNGIAAMEPGFQLEFCLGTLKGISERWASKVFKGTVNYQDADGSSYNESVVLDLTVFEELLTVDRRGLHDIHAALDKIAKTLGSLASGNQQAHVRVVTKEEAEEHDKRINSMVARHQAERALFPAKEAGVRGESTEPS